MKLNRRYLTVGATFFVAAATGHVMQNAGGYLRADTAPEEIAAISTGPEAEMPKMVTPLAANVLETVLPRLPEFPRLNTPRLAQGQSLAARIASLDDGQASTRIDSVEYDAFGLACAEIALGTKAKAAGMIAVSLSAPCRPNERVVLRHAGIEFADVTSDEGLLDLMIPALEADSTVMAEFAGGLSAQGAVDVPDFADWQRTVLQWQGQDGLHLNAYEYGAEYGSAGHVRPDATRAAGTAMGGFMTVLGNRELDRPMIAEVYSAPKDMTDIDIVIEAEVSSGNCGRSISATSTQMIDGVVFRPDAVSVLMPDCDAVGDFVLLNLQPRDFAVAGR